MSKIDSVKNSINESKLIRSPIFGVVEPFAEISGFAFLNLEGTEIKKLELEVLATHEAVTYYCYNNTIHFITTPQAIYYKGNNKYFVFHAIKDTILLTEEQLKLQEEFIKIIRTIIIK